MIGTLAQPAQDAVCEQALRNGPEIHIDVVSDVEDVGGEPKTEEVSPYPPVELNLNATHLISSPYNDLANQLRLSTLGIQSRLFAFALTYFNRIQDDYAIAPYMTTFNWPFVFEILRSLCQQARIEWQKQEFYVVIFRSKLRVDADRIRLGELDQKSHEEACASGGLLHYWFGKTDAERRNLATCESMP